VLQRAGEGLVALLGGLAVLVSETTGDLLPGGACGSGYCHQWTPLLATWDDISRNLLPMPFSRN